MMPSLLSNLPAVYRKWIIAFAFVGFLAGLGIGAYVAHQQNASDKPEAASQPQSAKAQQ